LILFDPVLIPCYNNCMNNDEMEKLRTLYTKMIESAQKGNDFHAFECARDISNSWYFKLFNEDAKDWVNHILTHYFV
jgi:hypothetical protein